jgi:ankyrin repeat protein
MRSMRSAAGTAIACVVLGLTRFGVVPVAIAQAPAKVDFQRDVQPIFRQQCYGCHGPSQQMNGFRLDRRRDAMRGGTIATLGPGNSDGSRLYQRLTGNRFGQQMPPTGALRPEQIDVIKRWIDEGADWPDAASGDAPIAPLDPKAARLMDAAMHHRTEQLRQLLDEGVSANVKNEGGATPLMRAAAANDFAAARLLLEHGANVNARSDDGRTPLLIASGLAGGVDLVKLLIEKGADVNAHAPGLVVDITTLSEAAYTGDVPVFRALVDAGASVRLAGPFALGMAFRSQCMPCVETLLKGIDKEALTMTMVLGGPPAGPALATPLLLERGADMNARDPEGRTLLMLAAASDAMAVDAVKVLIAKGADVNAATPAGETALGHARLRGNTPVVDLLVAAGAKDAHAPAIPEVKPLRASSVSAAIQRSLPLLQKNDETFLRKAGCVSCHNNTLTAETVAAARAKGLRVDEGIAGSQVQKIGTYLDAWRERALQGAAIPGDADTVSYILLGLGAEKFAPTPATDAMAYVLKRKQDANGQWRIFAHRPPLESSDIEVTAASMRALQLYAPAAERSEYDAAIAKAAAWLVNATPMSNEDRAFKLLGLAWSKADPDLISNAGAALVAEQKADGGWSQIPSLGSDAYATGQALVALAESGALKPSDAAFKKGVEFLLNTQYADGTWFVKTRALRIQPHFESGFPYGLDQFISAAATNWATRALTLAYVHPS